MEIKHILFLGIFAIGLYYWYDSRPITHEGKGQVAPNQPVQTDTKTIVFGFKEDYTVLPLADFEITARVLSRKRYRLDKEAKISPVDLALGWGPMSDDEVLSGLKISQSGRWYRWRSKTRELPVSRQQIEHNSANMHLIPADKEVEKAIKRAKKGDIVRFSGHLVRVHDKSGWTWVSSLTRKDTGAGACEVVFVKQFEIVTG